MTANAIFDRRLREREGVLLEALTGLYGASSDLSKIQARLIGAARKAYEARSPELLELDLKRETQDIDWFQSEKMAGYMGYVDRFADDFDGVKDKIGYLKNLGITYLHLLSVLRARDGDSDGGFAVTDYLSTNAALGNMDGLEDLARQLRANSISLCLDFALNHTAQEHDWAQRAITGDPHYRDFYFLFDGRAEPDRYERTLEDVFPATAPGNFTRVGDTDTWAWTTFYPYQWDLNYHNPDVLISMIEVLLELANRGVEVFRLDATIYLWKEMGTNCRNLPQVHDLLRVFKAVTSLAAPGTLLKAEAVSSARHLTGYLGNKQQRECDLAYHTGLMTALWDSLATADTTHMSAMMRSLPRKPEHTSWVYYVRCHDDIGWDVLKDSEETKWGATTGHLASLSHFYDGSVTGSFARGRSFQATEGKTVGGTNGTLASLAGLEQALDEHDQEAIKLAIKRILLLHAVIAGLDGMPLIYMGDELAALNDYDYLQHAGFSDGRWLHRGKILWDSGLLPHDLITARQTVFSGIRQLLQRRAELPVLNAENRMTILDTSERPLFAYLRQSDNNLLLCVANFSAKPLFLKKNCFAEYLSGQAMDVCPIGNEDQAIHQLGPYECRWLMPMGDNYSVS